MWNDVNLILTSVLSWIRTLFITMLTHPLLVVPIGLWVVGLVAQLFYDIKRRFF